MSRNSLTVLGKYGPFAKKGACSSYLFTCSKNIILDMGNGSLANLPISFDQIDIIILSHLHHDHISDIFLLRYAMQTSKKPWDKRIKLFLPDDLAIHKEIITDDFFDHLIIKDGLNIELDDVNISFSSVLHPTRTYATKIVCNQKSFVYTGDARFNYKLVDFSNECNLLLCDAGLMNEQKSGPHMTIAEAMELCRKANVQKALFTHINPYNSEKEIKEQIGKCKNIAIAEQGEVYWI